MMSLTVVLSCGSAACYVLATLAMKCWDAIGTFQAHLNSWVCIVPLFTGRLAIRSRNGLSANDPK